MTARIDMIENRWVWLAANLSVWLAFVLFFSQSIGLWRLLVSSFGFAFAGFVPIALSILLVATIAVVGLRRLEQLSWTWAAVSVAVFVLGLAATDAAFPAKRVHVPEYFALATLVYWSCRSHMPCQRSIWSAGMLVILLGGIDEIIQGAMPTRTFGLRDIVTNGLGAVSAGMFLEALKGRDAGEDPIFEDVLPLAVLVIGYGLFLLGVNAHKGIGIPFWVYLPAVASLPVLTLFARSNDDRVLPASAAVCAIALVSMCGIDALDVDFR